VPCSILMRPAEAPEQVGTLRDTTCPARGPVRFSPRFGYNLVWPSPLAHWLHLRSCGRIGNAQTDAVPRPNTESDIAFDGFQPAGSRQAARWPRMASLGPRLRSAGLLVVPARRSAARRRGGRGPGSVYRAGREDLGFPPGSPGGHVPGLVEDHYAKQAARSFSLGRAIGSRSGWERCESLAGSDPSSPAANAQPQRYRCCRAVRVGPKRRGVGADECGTSYLASVLDGRCAGTSCGGRRGRIGDDSSRSLQSQVPSDSAISPGAGELAGLSFLVTGIRGVSLPGLGRQAGSLPPR